MQVRSHNFNWSCAFISHNLYALFVIDSQSEFDVGKCINSFFFLVIDMDVVHVFFVLWDFFFFTFSLIFIAERLKLTKHILFFAHTKTLWASYVWKKCHNPRAQVKVPPCASNVDVFSCKLYAQVVKPLHQIVKINKLQLKKICRFLSRLVLFLLSSQQQ